MAYYNTSGFMGNESNLLILAQELNSAVNGWIGTTIISIVLITIVIVLTSLGFRMKDSIVSSLWASMLLGIVMFLGELLSGTILFALIIASALSVLWLFIDD